MLENTSALFNRQSFSFGILFIVLLTGFYYPPNNFCKKANFMTPVQISQILITRLQIKAILL